MRDMRGLGNRLRHAYDSIDTRLIWLIVEKDLAPLKASTLQNSRELMNSRCAAPHFARNFNDAS
jgi:uncharacterized protein with HEPN domain